MISSTFGTASRKATRRMALAAAVVGGLSLLVLGDVLLLSWPGIPFRTDFVSFWVGATLVRDGAGPSMFDLNAQRFFRSDLWSPSNYDVVGFLGDEYRPFVSLPAMAIPYLPLVAFPVPVAYLIWWGISLLAFLAGVALPLRGRPLARYWTVIALAFGAVTSTLYEGQVYGLFLLALSLGMLSMAAGRPFLGGLLLGLLWAKPQYAVLFALVFLAKRRWRELCGMAAAGFAVALVSAAMVGPSGLDSYLALLRELASFDSSSVNPQAMINWRALLVNLWPDLPAASGAALVLGLGAVTALASLPAWIGPWDPRADRFPRQLAVTVLATLVASPHSHFHGMALLLAPGVLMASAPGDRPAFGRALRWTAVLGYGLAEVGWFYVRWRWLMMPFLLVAMALLILQCLWCLPRESLPPPLRRLLPGTAPSPAGA